MGAWAGLTNINSVRKTFSMKFKVIEDIMGMITGDHDLSYRLFAYGLFLLV